jgi:DNA-binding response OmpR family regulator
MAFQRGISCENRGKDVPLTHILVVDRSQPTAGMIAEYLRKAGHIVTVKNDLPEALKWLRIPGNLPDLMISDVMISRVNGHQLIRQVRADPNAAYPSIILLGAKDDMAEKIAGFEAGADDYLEKPVDVIELGLRVRAVLARTQAWRPTTSFLRVDLHTVRSFGK